MMRRRIAQRDVCLFCAFRPGVWDTFASTPQARRAVREYHPSAIKPSAAGFATARDEEDESESPMLRKNSNLASSFPARRQSIQPPPPKLEQFEPLQAPPVASENQDRGRLQNKRSLKEGGPAFRHNSTAFAHRQNARQPGRAQVNRWDGSEDGHALAGSDAGRGIENRSRRFEGWSAPRQDRLSEGNPSVDRGGLSVRRFVPSQNFEDAVADLLDSPRTSVNRSDRAQSRNAQNQAHLFRKVSTAGLGENRQRSQQLSIAEGGSKQKSKGLNSPEVSTQSTETGEDFGVPSGPSFPAVEREITFHHRRAPPDEKRKSRSSRFEEEDDDQESVALPAATHKALTLRARNTMRSNDFDFDAIEAEAALYGGGGRRKKNKKNRQASEVAQSRPTLKITEYMSVAQLAKAVGAPLESFTQRLEEEGWVGARYDQVLPAQDSSMIADLYGFDPVVAAEEAGTDLFARPPPEDISALPARPPIVTIMGHVDHGKTTILDYLRKSSVVASEHGGITQHIGAFSVTMPGTSRQITFLDTPGHAAFLEMRRRGANVTDIVVLVVAADDSVKPQTIEAIKHAMEAKVQIIVAINKVDKEDSNIERVKQDLTRHEIVVEDYGGDFQAIPVSGKTGQGMAELEEAIITLADVHDFRAEKDGPAEGTIIESKVTTAGRVATVLVRRGTLRPGDFIVAGHTWARVRTLRDDTGALVDEAPPGTPVQVDGWRGEDPTAGLEVLQAENEEQAKDVIDFRLEQRESNRTSADMAAINESRSEEAEARAKVLAWEAQQEWAKRSHSRRPKDNAGWVEPEVGSGPKQVHFIVKADVAGSVEAVTAAVAAVGNNEIVANVIHSGTGQVAESDIRMLAASGEIGYAITFNQPVDGTMYRLAEEAGLQILDHNIIYKVTDTVKEKLAEQLPPLITQKVLGEAEVGQIFDVTIKKNKIKIAGCRVTNGTVSRAHKVRVLRDGSVIYTGTLHSLKNVKKDVTEMRKGTECGMGFENWEDFQAGDQIQCFEENEEKRTFY